MATNKLTLLIELSDKMYNSGLGKMQRQWEKTVDKMKIKYKSLVDRLPAGLGNMVNKMKLPLTGMAIGAATIFGTLANKGIDAAARFDDAFLPIRNLNLDKSKAELDDYRAKIRDAAFDIGANLTDSTNAVYDLQSATGMYGDDVIEIYKKIGKYSIVTGANINDSMNSTTKAMKAFKLGVQDIDKLLESNAKTVQVGITTFDELAKVQTEYAGTASAAGQGVDVANKVFAMFTSVAKNSDIGANLTKTFFQGLGQQADKFEDVLKVKVFDAKGSMRQADDILKDISKKFKTMTDQEITEAINKVGGPEGLRGALDKVKTGAEDMIATFNAFDSSQFSLKEAMENAEGDVTKMRELFNNRLEAILSKFGEKFYPLIAQIFDKLNPLLEFLYQNFDTVAIVLGTLTTALGIATVAVWALNSAFLANPITWIILGIGALIALVITAIKHFDTWGATLLWFLGPIGRVIAALKLIYDHWESIKQAFNDGGIIGALQRIGTVLMDVILQPVEQLLNLLSNLPGRFGEIAASAKNSLHSIRENMDLVNTSAEIHQQKRAEMLKKWGSETAYYEHLQKSKEKEEAPKPSLYDSLGKGRSGTSSAGSKTKAKLSNDVAKVSGAAKEVKNISIKFEALHKGDNQISNGAGQGMTMQQFEAMYQELLMRIIRNAELS